MKRSYQARSGIAAIEQWLAMMREAFATNYDRLDNVLAEMQLETGKGQDDE